MYSFVFSSFGIVIPVNIYIYIRMYLDVVIGYVVIGFSLSSNFFLYAFLSLSIVNVNV